MARFASETTITAEKSRQEIETILTRYGASSFLYAWEGPRAVIGFRASGRMVRFTLPLPEQSERRFTHSTRGQRTAADARAAWEQGCRSAWRALALVIKAKLEAVESGITDFESEFMAAIALPSGQSVAQWLKPQIESAYATGEMPKQLLALPAPKENQ